MDAKTAKEFADSLPDDMRPSHYMEQAFSAVYSDASAHVTDERSCIIWIGGAIETAVEAAGGNEIAIKITMNAISLALRCHYEAMASGWTKNKFLNEFNTRGGQTLAEIRAKEELVFSQMRTAPEGTDAVEFLKARYEKAKKDGGGRTH